jgi:Predicted transcriptional regulators
MKIDKSNNKYIYVIVGKNLRKIRKEKELTQVQLTELTGYNEGTISNIENNSYQTFSLEFIYVISKILNVSIKRFFDDIED